MAIIVCTTRLEITAGPSRDSLCDSLKRAYDCDKVPVFLRAKSGRVYKAVITSLKHEDGSGYNYLVEGFITYPEAKTVYGETFEGFLGCRSRNGYIDVSIQYATHKANPCPGDRESCQANLEELYY